MGARRRPLANNNVELIILKRRVKLLFQHRLHAVDLVQEEDLALAQVGENRGQVTLNLQRRAGGLLEADVEFIGNDGGKRRLSQAGRAEKQHMIKSFAAGFCRLEGNGQLFLGFRLANELPQPPGTELEFKALLFVGAGSAHQSFRRVVANNRHADARIQVESETVQCVNRTLVRYPATLSQRKSESQCLSQGSFRKLRPRWLGEFIGQSKAKEQLSIALQAAKSRGEALDHVLLFGPPGLGKTTLATLIANELDVGFQQTSGPALQIQGDLTAILTNLRERQVLFLDEIHRMQPVLEEKLYTALEDYKLDIIIGQGPAARTHVMEIRPFTFIGATTRPGLLSSPLRSRFGILLRLEFYTEEELRFIVTRSAEVMGVPIDQDGAAEIALRSRGTPRIANRLLRRVRDYAQVRGSGTIDRPTANAALTMLEVDAHGFDEIDRKLLLAIIQKYDGGPVGLSTLAATLAEEQDALEEVYEPFLIQIGFLDRTPRGRVATRLAYEHFGLAMPGRQAPLF